jgi:uncharacterized protein (DUF433 family)
MRNLAARTRRVHDLLEQPSYRINEAAGYLGVPETTLRSWVRGQRLGARRASQPIIHLPAGEPPMLSFTNLLEAHVVNAFRRKGVPLQHIRRALVYLGQELPSKHPLIDNEFMTFGWRIVIDRFQQYVEISHDGQMAIKEVVQGHLSRIRRDASGSPIRLYPFTRKQRGEGPETVVIDPTISFGRPVLVGTGIPIDEIAARHRAGDSIQEIANDYGRTPQEIEEAIRFQEAA